MTEDLRTKLNNLYQTNISDNDEIQTCPFCKEYRETNTRIIEVAINAGGEITITNNNGTEVSYGKSTGRGTQVNILCQCESGHTWLERMQFCKGFVYRTIEEVDDLLPLSDILEGLKCGCDMKEVK